MQILSLFTHLSVVPMSYAVFFQTTKGEIYFKKIVLITHIQIIAVGSNWHQFKKNAEVSQNGPV